MTGIRRIIGRIKSGERGQRQMTVLDGETAHDVRRLAELMRRYGLPGSVLEEVLLLMSAADFNEALAIIRRVG